MWLHKPENNNDDNDNYHHINNDNHWGEQQQQQQPKTHLVIFFFVQNVILFSSVVFLHEKKKLYELYNYKRRVEWRIGKEFIKSHRWRKTKWRKIGKTKKIISEICFFVKKIFSHHSDFKKNLNKEKQQRQETIT